ncbi:Activity-regulated cytoskeleton associated protein 1 [Carabus blaptoides fortunei]
MNENSGYMPPKRDTQGVMFSDEQFQELITRITSSVAAHGEQGDRHTPSPTNSYQSAGSYAKCTSRFNGSETSDVDAFLDAILTYKECMNISDENAFRGLPMLLEGHAATWWKGIKQTIENWDSAVSSLRDVYSRKLAAHLVYREIFAHEQRDNEQTELYVCHFRALIAQLPYSLEDRAQLDMLYGLLRRDIRKRITRSEFDSFKVLLKRVRDIEISLKEITQKHSESKEDKKVTRPRCSHCKIYGHTIAECRNKLRTEEKKPPKVDAADKRNDDTRRTVYCYGCKAPGVIRAECPKCSPKPTNTEAKVGSIEFYEARVEPPNANIANRPTLPISINGLKGNVLADTGASRSIAGRNLYEKLKNSHQFTTEKVQITLADGSTSTKMVQSTEAEVIIANKKIQTKLLVLPIDHDNRTILGMDFLTTAGIVIDTANKEWSFSDDANTKYSYAEQIPLSVANVNCTKDTDESTRLRIDEGTHLSTEERNSVNEMLDINQEIFRRGGEPTTYAEHRMNVKPDQMPIANRLDEDGNVRRFLLHMSHTMNRLGGYLEVANEIHDRKSPEPEPLQVVEEELFLAPEPVLEIEIPFLPPEVFTSFHTATSMAPRGKGKQSAVFVWTDGRKENLDCWQEIILANEARAVNNRSNTKQLSAELRRLFCARFPECKLAAATLYKYVNDIAHDRPVPVSEATSQDNLHAVRLGLMAGKRGRPSTFRRILIDLFCHRYPNIAESSVFNRCTELRKQKRIHDGGQPSAPALTDSNDNDKIAANVSVVDIVTGAQHVRDDYETVTRGHADVCQVTFGDPHLEAKLFPWLIPYGTGCNDDGDDGCLKENNTEETTSKVLKDRKGRTLRKHCLVQNDDDGGKPEMPTVGQLTYRPGGCIIKPAEIASQHTWTQQWMLEIAHRERCHYHSRNPTYQIDQGRTDRFYDLFAEQRGWGGAAHLTAIAQIARRDVYVYNILINEDWKHAPVLYLQEALDNNEMRGSLHIRYESQQPPFNNHKPLALLLSDAGTNTSHYSAILPLCAGTFLLKPVAMLPPHR